MKGLLRPTPRQVQPERSVTGEAFFLPDDLISEEDLMKWLSVDRQWLADHRTRVLPIIPHIRLGKTIRYSRSRISAWLGGCVETRPRWERGE